MNHQVASFFGILKATLLLLVIILLLPLIPNVPPNVKYSAFSVSDPIPLEGKLVVNTLFDGAERLFEGEVNGPEGFAVVNGKLYTSLHGGFVARIENGEIEPVVKYGQPCDPWIEEYKCGRPLGLFAGSGNTLYVADSFYGIFAYDVETEKSTKFVGPEMTIEGRRPKNFNALAVAKDGTIYWSDSTSDFTTDNAVLAMLADGTGRLIKYDPRTQAHTVLIDGLLCANGVALSPDDSFVLVAESGMSRIHRFWLMGPRRGTSDILLDALPGIPDNIRAGDNRFLISLVIARDSGNPALFQTIMPFPYIRKAISSAIATLSLFFQQIDEAYPNYVSKRAVQYLGSFEMTRAMIPPRVTLVVVDLNGNVIDSFHATDYKVTGISDGILHDGKIYLGSPFNDYLGLIQDPKVVARFEKAFFAKKPETTTTKPKTTPQSTTTATPQPTSTPKPTTSKTSPESKTSTKSNAKPTQAAKSAQKQTTSPPKPRDTNPSDRNEL